MKDVPFYLVSDLNVTKCHVDVSFNLGGCINSNGLAFPPNFLKLATLCLSAANSVQNGLKRVRSVEFAFLVGSVGSSFSSARGTGTRCLCSVHSVQFTNCSGPASELLRSAQLADQTTVALCCGSLQAGVVCCVYLQSGAVSAGWRSAVWPRRPVS